LTQHWRFSVALFILIILLAVFVMGDYLLFRNKGARFTAKDGQELCQRLQKMDGLPYLYIQPSGNL